MAPKISRTSLSIFFSTEPIPRIHGAQTYHRTRLWVYRMFFVLSQFLFSIAFFRTKMVHPVLFRHLGFAGSDQCFPFEMSSTFSFLIYCFCRLFLGCFATVLGHGDMTLLRSLALDPADDFGLLGV